MKYKVAIVIAAYNEAGKIAEVLAGFTNTGYLVIVVDDGSEDKTYAIACNYPVHALRHPFNLGQGAALQTGLSFARHLNADVAVTFDADGQHHFEDVDKIIQPILTNNADIVFGSRFLGKTINMPKGRGLFIKLAGNIFNFISGVSLSDTNCGIRAFGRKALEDIYITQNKMAHTLDIIEHVKKCNLRYTECPVTIEYTDYSINKGQSLSGSLRIFMDWFFRL